MEVDDLSWIAGQLGFVQLRETAGGVLTSAGQDASAVSPPEQAALEVVIARRLGLETVSAELSAAVQAARDGERRSINVHHAGRVHQVLCVPAEAGRACATLCEAPIERDRAARSGLVDVAAAVSHEVANAVGSIRGWADLALHNGDATVDLRDALTLIRGAAKSAEQAARSMLSLARGEVASSAESSTDLSEFASELLQLLTLTAREHRVALESAIEPGLSVRAQRAQLFTILFNLVKNAIEACAPGGLVSVRVEGDRERVQLSVRDSGEGLDAASQARLFDPYYTTKQSGTGLGLALVRQAVEATGAELSLDSAKGRGTQFRVVFSRAERIEEASITSPASGGEHVLHARVLVVDDDRALRELVATALSLRGAHVVCAGSADQALELEEPFDIALIDMMLEGRRGDELLALLRQQGIVQAAMLVTGTVQKPRLVPGGEPDDWLRKPFEIALLVERIRRTLERHRMLDVASNSARQLS